MAALMVVLFHVRWTNHLTDTGFFVRGYLFVDLFFVLSGFVLSASYLKRIRNFPEIRRFLRKRFFRIYPLHLAMLAALVALELLKVFGEKSGMWVPEHKPFTGTNSTIDLIYNLLLLHSLNVSDHTSWNIPSWSISSEAACYIVFAFATRIGLTSSRLMGALSLVVALICYGYVILQKGNLDATYDYGFLRGLAGMSLGIWLFHLSQRALFARLSSRILTTNFCVLLISASATLWFSTRVADIAAIIVFFASVLLLCQDRGVGASLLSTKAVSFLGKISYSIYMVHVPILTCLGIVLRRVLPASARSIDANGYERFLMNPWLGDVLLAGIIALILFISVRLFKSIEEPWREFGKKCGIVKTKFATR
ncbi:acyltransferase family protein [Bradyrhizobium amphicarpaeae]|uniref:Acyltransferase n=1 Tax=Bradyrhizobium amphicarpaeae TaxID=1404768 RepID=A0A2U8PPV0_9BRAD|nr:acyltransferase [Bradyrhizobium amphicarpaeae]